MLHPRINVSSEADATIWSYGIGGGANVAITASERWEVVPGMRLHFSPDNSREAAGLAKLAIHLQVAARFRW
jgi:hypothetical protein